MNKEAETFDGANKLNHNKLKVHLIVELYQ